MTKSEVAKLVTVLMGSYPSSWVTERTSAVYEEMLQDLDYARANAVVRRLIMTAKKLPTIAEIREGALEVARGPVRPGGEAWREFMGAMATHGTYRTPGVDFEFDDPLVARTVAALGWRDLGLSENSTADRARFIELYDRYARVERHEQIASPFMPARELSGQVARQLPSGNGEKA